jgi:DNA-binding response OmpR family regulator
MTDNRNSEVQGRKRVLVVEDDFDMNELVCLMLDDAGYDTMQAFCGDEGLRMASEYRPDLVLLDIMLPDKNGIDICRNITAGERTQKIPVIIMTCRNDLTTKLSSYVSGAKRYITKPFEEMHLLSELERTLS